MAETTTPIARLNELIQGIDIAVLTTVRPDGSLHSRPMASRAADERGVLWFLSHNNSEKVEAVRTSQHVNVAYADHTAQRYVSVSGFCELVRDHGMTKRLWQPGYAAWYSGGPEDPGLVLLKVVVQQAEYWDAAHRRMVLLAGFPGMV
ncbi:MAG TPA: pyridoxamine 5'-phosphate oxidase family protein [Bryocella sp.]|nr:pyridoxamine 5'-phosphate oxidase family protein [Bryocella sp.]